MQDKSDGRDHDEDQAFDENAHIDGKDCQNSECFAFKYFKIKNSIKYFLIYLFVFF